jgi:hypothetical protein
MPENRHLLVNDYHFFIFFQIWGNFAVFLSFLRFFLNFFSKYRKKYLTLGLVFGII